MIGLLIGGDEGEESKDREVELYAVIMAGGVGTRLWPRSRQSTPKQLLDIVTENTMLQETFLRIEPLIPPDKVFVITNGTYAPIVREQIPQLPRENVIVEPAGRNTAPCIGLAALYLRQLDPEGVMVVLPSDHLICKAPHFRDTLKVVAEVAQGGHLVTMGIQPDSPHTGYGYIQRGDFLRQMGQHGVYKVARFTEKPDEATAQRFLDSGQYYWNSGMFGWKVSAILEAIEVHLPTLHARLMAIEAALGSQGEREVMEEVWQGVESISVDYGIMERADNVAVIPMDVGWSDVGSWATVAELMPKDAEDNVVIGEHIGIDTTGSLLYSSGRLIATIGLRDIIVVDTGDAVLVCPKSRAQEVKELVGELRGKQKDEYL
jgi:mannose-1-phosphate guanylyltransferase